MTAVIRSAAAADAAAITSVFLASRAATMAYLPRLYDDEQTAAWITHVVLPHCQVWVAQSPEVVGFVAVRDNHIGHLYLHPDHQRRASVNTRGASGGSSGSAHSPSTPG